jgi:hypothetical protein
VSELLAPSGQVLLVLLRPHWTCALPTRPTPTRTAGESRPAGRATADLGRTGQDRSPTTAMGWRRGNACGKARDGPGPGHVGPGHPIGTPRPLPVPVSRLLQAVTGRDDDRDNANDRMRGRSRIVANRLGCSRRRWREVREVTTIPLLADTTPSSGGRSLGAAACADSLSAVSVSGVHLAGPAAGIRPAIRFGLGIRRVAAPVPVLRVGPAQVDHSAAALSAGWWFRERPRLRGGVASERSIHLA